VVFDLTFQEKAPSPRRYVGTRG